MNKIIGFCCVSVMVFALAASSVYAAPTTTVTVEEITDAPNMDVSTGGVIEWTHTFDPTCKDILSVELEIRAYDVDYPQYSEADYVYADGTYIGRLTGTNDAWSLNTFSIDPSLLSDGQLDILVNADAYYSGWRVEIDYGKLTTEWTEACINTVPAPGAILLGSLGLGAVSWLRRRKTL